MSLDKKLLEEINRFRMMSSYKPGKLLHEQDEKEIDNNYTKIFGSDQKFEKFSPANVETVEIYMTEDLNELIIEKQDEYMKKIPIDLDNTFKLTLNNDVVLTPYDFCGNYKRGVYFNNDRVLTLQACQNDVLLYQLKNNTYSITLMDEYNEPYESESIGVETNFKVDGLLNDFLAKYPEYNSFFEQYKEKYLENGMSISEYVKNMINNVTIPIMIQPESKENLYKFGFTVENTRDNKLSDYSKTKKEYKEIILSMRNKNGTSISGNFYDVFESTNFIVPMGGDNNKYYSYLKNNFAIFKMGRLVLSIPPQFESGGGENNDIYPTPTPTPPPPPEEIAFDFVVQTAKNYEFDKAELTQDAKDEIDQNITQKFLNILPKYQDGYLNFIKDKEILVYAYASIDADPDAADGGRYDGCSKYGVGKGPRREYNKCLSQARAEAVVNYLKTTQGGIFKDVNFKPIGMGETCQFSKLCWKVKSPGSNEKSPYSTSETYPDRRFSVNFPKYHADF